MRSGLAKCVQQRAEKALGNITVHDLLIINLTHVTACNATVMSKLQLLNMRVIDFCWQCDRDKPQCSQ